MKMWPCAELTAETVSGEVQVQDTRRKLSPFLSATKISGAVQVRMESEPPLYVPYTTLSFDGRPAVDRSRQPMTSVR
jgi:hypothetical protein